MDEEFFSQYNKAAAKEKVQGIPNVIMNQPLVQNAYEGTIGLELEVEATMALPRDGHLDFRAPRTGVRWTGVTDGSLRGEAREYIFSGPARRDEVPDLVNRLFKSFSDLKSGVENSNRCSTHVHINMKGRTVNELTSIIALWGTFEDMLIAWNGEERVSNHFCLGIKDSGSLVQAWEQYLRSGYFAGLGEDRHGLKYMAFNILPLWRKGSFEIRCGGAPNDAKTVITWATFVDTFVEYAYTRYPDPTQIASDLSERGGYAIFSDICKDFPEFLSEVVGPDIEGFDEKALNGFRLVQPLVLGFPWPTWLGLINREYIPNPFEKPKSVKQGNFRVAVPPFRPMRREDAPVPVNAAMAGRADVGVPTFDAAGRNIETVDWAQEILRAGAARAAAVDNF